MEQEKLAGRRRAKVEAEISLSAIRQNYLNMKQCVPDANICCVVKADAYGHGAHAVCPMLAQAGVNFFAVSSIAEAEDVRLSLGGHKAEILILGYTIPTDVDLLLKYDITQTVFSTEYAGALSAALEQTAPGAQLKIHVKLDTGMNRLGFCPEATDEIAAVCALPGLDAKGIFTHFVMSDEPAQPMTKRQFDRYTAAVAALKQHSVTFSVHHVCNSAAITNFPEMHLDMVRLGIELYGLAPSADTLLPPLTPAMTVRSIISHIHTVHPGESISYGGMYIAEKPVRVATVPIGYADGYIRAYAKDGYMTVCGQRAKILGRICMDQCMVDITDIPDAEIGTPVTVFGADAPCADELAAWSDTINYEVTCIIGKRVPRAYHETV